MFTIIRKCLDRFKLPTVLLVPVPTCTVALFYDCEKMQVGVKVSSKIKIVMMSVWTMFLRYLFNLNDFNLTCLDITIIVVSRRCQTPI